HPPPRQQDGEPDQDDALERDAQKACGGKAEEALREHEDGPDEEERKQRQGRLQRTGPPCRGRPHCVRHGPTRPPTAPRPSRARPGGCATATTAPARATRSAPWPPAGEPEQRRLRAACPQSPRSAR